MTDEERKQVESLTRERDFWRAKYRSCAWCKGNVELADHSDDCPVKRCQRLEVERDELRGVMTAVWRWRFDSSADAKSNLETAVDKLLYGKEAP